LKRIRDLSSMEHLPFLVLMKKSHTIDRRPDPEAGDFTDTRERPIAGRGFLRAQGLRTRFGNPLSL
jgi:hypothetical protein